MQVKQGDGELLRRYVKLSGTGRSLDVNKAVGRAEFVSITNDEGGRGGGRENERIFSTNLT